MEQVNKGRKTVLVLIVIALLIDILSTAAISSLYQQIGATDVASYKLLQGIFRFILTCILFFFLYKGYSWSKWLCAILFLLSGGYSLIAAISNFNIIVLILGLFYFLLGIVLFASKSVKTFFSYQRGRFTPGVKEITGDWNSRQHSQE